MAIAEDQELAALLAEQSRRKKPQVQDVTDQMQPVALNQVPPELQAQLSQAQNNNQYLDVTQDPNAELQMLLEEQASRQGGSTQPAMFAPNPDDPALMRYGKAFLNQAAGTPEVAASMLTGIPGGMAGYAAGALTAPFVGGTKSEEIANQVAQTMTYQPQTEYGQRVMGNIGTVTSPLMWPGEALGYVGKQIDKATGNTTQDMEVGLKNVGNAPLMAFGAKQMGLRQGLEKIGIVPKASKLIVNTEKAINQNVAKAVNEHYYNITKPTGAKKLYQITKRGEHIGTAERFVAENKEMFNYVDEATGETSAGHVPKTALQWAQAWDQGLKMLWQRAEELVTKETGRGITIDRAPFVKELKAIAAKNADASPQVSAQALGLAERLTKSPTMTLPQAVEQLGQINSRQGGKLTPGYNDYGSMQVDAAHANFLKGQLSSKVNGIKELRSLMADFKDSEAGIMRAVQKKLNLSNEMVSKLDVHSIAAGVYAFVNSNPAVAASAGVWAALKALKNRAKSVDFQVNKMFTAVEKATEPGKNMSRAFATGLVEQDTQPKQLGWNPQMGMPEQRPFLGSPQGPSQTVVKDSRGRNIIREDISYVSPVQEVGNPDPWTRTSPDILQQERMNFVNRLSRPDRYAGKSAKESAEAIGANRSKPYREHNAYYVNSAGEKVFAGTRNRKWFSDPERTLDSADTFMDAIKAKGMKPEDLSAMKTDQILSIWREVDQTKIDPKLAEYIKGLSSAEKVELARGAIKGEIPSWVDFKFSETPPGPIDDLLRPGGTKNNIRDHLRK